jgi:hypothetical protein
MLWRSGVEELMHCANISDQVISDQGVENLVLLWGLSVEGPLVLLL